VHLEAAGGNSIDDFRQSGPSINRSIESEDVVDSRKSSSSDRGAGLFRADSVKEGAEEKRGGERGGDGGGEKEAAERLKGEEKRGILEGVGVTGMVAEVATHDGEHGGDLGEDHA
jgi:hypothetical protein